jgi:uncharacterized membrane protein YqjE
MATDPEEDRPGLLASLGRLIGSAVGLVQTRLELLSNDIAFERSQLLRLVIVGAAAIVFLQAGILMGAIFLVLVVPESARALAVGIAAAVLLGSALGSVLWLRHSLKTRPPFFAATIGELKKDRDRLKGGR